MTSVDNRVVHMQFDNAAFERGVAQTLASLNRLNQGLQLQGAAKGLQGIGNSANAQVGSLKNMEAGVNSVAGRFTALQQIATGALHNIGARISESAIQMGKSLTLEPLIDGFHEYETNLNSIQTILANTQASGATLKDVNHELNELNHYSDQTIYNFSEMAKNIGTFTAAGVDLKTSTAAIKGIANLAALSGSNSEQAAGAMYQLSQAISAGRVSLEDWNSVVNAGMGGTVFQRALALNAEKLGTLSKGAVELKGKMKNVTIEGKSFRESITAKPGEESWLTSKVLTQTLAQFTGDLSDADLAAQGFNKSQIKAIQAQAKTAREAATQVKTLSQLFDTTKEALGSGWSQTWQTIFGDFTEAKGLFTGASNAIGKIVGDSADARNKMLSDWKDLGGRDALIKGITNAFQALFSILRPIKDAFREIFPATTGKQLYEMTVSFRDFMERLKLGSQTAENLKRTFAGFFAILGIGWEIVKQVAKTIFGLFGEVGKGSGGFLSATASVGDFLVALHKAVKEGEGLHKFFEGLGKVLAVPIKLVAKLGGYLADLFSGGDAAAAGKGIGELTDKLSPMAKLGEMVSNAWEHFGDIMDRVWTGVQKVGKAISDFFSKIGTTITEGLDIDFSTMFAGINTGLIAGIFLIIKRFMSGGGAGGGILDGITEAIEGFTGVLKGMQNALNAATLLQIAIAVGILALSMNTLSKIDANGLGRASAAMAGLFTQLLGSLAIFNKFIGAAGFAKLPFVMGSLILLAGAILILTQAVKQLAGLDWNELAKGLTGLAVTLGLVVGSLKVMPNPKGMISTGLGLIALAAGIKILASAVTDLSGLSWQELAKGLVGVGALLGALVLFTMFNKVNKGGVLQGAGLILLAAGIKILASAVADMSKLSWGGIAKGLVTLAGALAIITAALYLIPPTAPLAAAGVLLTAMSLGMVAEALDKMAQMSWGEIGKSLVVMLGALTLIAAALYVVPPTAPLAAAGILITALALQQVAKVLNDFAQFGWEEIGKSMVMLAGTLGIIAAALFVMTGALPGAAAVLIIAAALTVLAPVLMQFSQMSLGEIGTSLLMLAGVFAVFGLAALVLAPVVPVMIALAAAVTLLGIGVLAAGAGVFLFATGLTALAAAGVAGTAAIVGIVSGLIGLIPMVMEQIGKGLIAFAKVIATAGPAITKAIVTVLESLISAIVRVTPKIVDALLRMLSMMLSKMLQYVPKMVDTGLKLLIGILQGIANNIGKVIDTATKVAVNFINGVARNLPKIIQAGVNLILSFINGVTKAIDSNAEKLGAAGGRLAVAIVKGMAKGIMAGIGEIKNAAVSVAKSALDGAKSFLGIHSPSKEFEKVGNYVNDGFRKGLDGNKKQVYDAFDDLKKMLKDLSKSSKASSSERKKAAAAYNELTKKLNDEKSAIGKLADKYDVLTDKIKSADEAYKNAIKTRDDYRKQITDQYSDMASPTGEISVEEYTKNLQKQVEDTKVFSNTLQRLRKLGLNDETYKDLLSQGVSALPFVENLLKEGKPAVDEINKLGKELDQAGAALGKTASDNLYQAAVNSAKGLLDGLKKQQKAIEAVMDAIATKMVNSIKKKLKIKSPSRVFMEIGDFTGKGLAKGLDGTSKIVAKSASDIGDGAIDSVRKSISGFSDLITSDMATRPTITPVLDLSGVRKDAAQLGKILPDQGISLDAAYAKAKFVRDSLATQRAAVEQADVESPAGTVNYTQNNYSPKALSQAEIYRQTKNQLSTVKGALSTSASTG
ncbi:tape measure protein [Streptomyces phage Annihilus]|nr:tape measure protein [Streptomyces phage Annihilus]